ncbi:MAG: hypothetical protein ACXQS4_03865, partial [Methermicoccaceae archaeon]
VLSRRGLFAAMAALQGARGGVDIPAGERKAVYNHLAAHYADLELEPPELAASAASALASETEGEDDQMAKREGESMAKKEDKEVGASTMEAATDKEAAREQPVYTKEQVEQMIVAAAEKAKAETLEHLMREQHVKAIVEAMLAAGALKPEEAEGRTRQLMQLPSEVLAAERAAWQKAAENIGASSKLDKATLGDVGASGLTLGRWNNDTKQWEV